MRTRKIKANEDVLFYFMPIYFKRFNNSGRNINYPIRCKQVLKWMRMRYHSCRVIYDGNFTEEKYYGN